MVRIRWKSEYLGLGILVWGFGMRMYPANSQGNQSQTLEGWVCKMPDFSDWSLQCSGKIILNLLFTCELLSLRRGAALPSHTPTLLSWEDLTAALRTGGVIQDEKWVMNNEKIQALGINDSYWNISALDSFLLLIFHLDCTNGYAVPIPVHFHRD